MLYGWHESITSSLGCASLVGQGPFTVTVHNIFPKGRFANGQLIGRHGGGERGGTKNFSVLKIE
jgi:hypothetical protein